jgi:voltage-gated sodium channel
MGMNLRSIIDSSQFQKLTIGLIVVNAVILGLETYPAIMQQYGTLLVAVDHAILWFFVAEISARIMVYRLAFFKDAWNIFDFLVVGISLMPAQEAFSVLRALRVLRVLRLITAIPRLRRVVQGLISAIPGIGSIALVMLLIFYVFAVMSVKLFGVDYPEWFGTLGNSFFTLFQIMTLEGWADMVRTIMQTAPWSWVFFVVYILVATFTVLNLFIAVIVEAMQQEHALEEKAEDEQEAATLEALRREIADVKSMLEEMRK